MEPSKDGSIRPIKSNKAPVKNARRISSAGNDAHHTDHFGGGNQGLWAKYLSQRSEILRNESAGPTLPISISFSI